ncbi:serine/threonine-protein kinase [Niveomyces insectorum RCEF 264]|uniref:Serine/threonine-protein kinase n=1 Tax=Niveomyces insectorum RCEF 264 TaxID=1081102 RepID=A0A167QRD5_9HYPO|nr:serine/threonine-protein kinase [Niveomyces insectorum RCEF 264]
MACLREKFHDGVVLGGRYRTVAPLNHGSFGMVFMAKDMTTGDSVAIKCLTKKAAADEAGLDFAIDDKSEELALHRRLGRHPNIVNLIESFETESHVYLVLEFCPRGDLYEAIRNGHGPLETEHVRSFMLELVDAVAYIHSKGIYHRDIKPENIFLSQSGTMKLGDFGLATTDKWTHEATVGSDRYMSPEQFDSAGAGYSPAQADIWAIGICLLNILFSRNPFTTPTEEDPLFLDFSRDKQSLFDVFPSMSQDTFEVIVECLNLDPRKRSLSGVRDALRRVVTFTTLDEALDDFCSVDRRVVASANREPLRTPSIQSPQVEYGAFSWAKALQTSSPQAIRQLSVIPDNESYSEELFSKSGATTADWCSNMTGETPSMASVLDSSLAASMNSLAVSRPQMIPPPKQSQAKVSPMAGSLPITMPRARNVPSMSLVFGRKDAVSKSWSDMWEEDAEEEAERLRQLENRKKLNARTWSQDSTHDRETAEEANAKLGFSAGGTKDNTPRMGLSPAEETAVIDESVPVVHQAVPAVDVHDDSEDDGLFFADPVFEDKHDRSGSNGHGYANEAHHQQYHLSVRLPQPPSPFPAASKSPSAFDKWEALGEKRRAYTGSSSAGHDSKPREFGLRTGQQVGNYLGYGLNNSTYGYGVSDHFGFGDHQAHRNHLHNMHNNTANNAFNHHFAISHSHTNGHNKVYAGKENVKDHRVKECPWNKGRDRSWNWRRDRRADFGDIEWVGGWQEAHS